MPVFADVIIDKPLAQSFQYLIPEKLENSIKVGHFVKIPFGKKEDIGLVIDLPTSASYPIEKLKRIIDVINPNIVVPQEILELTRWLSEYYESSWGEAVFAATPSSIRKKSTKKINAIRILNPNIDNFSSENQKKIFDFLKAKTEPVPVSVLIGGMSFSGSSLKTLLQKKIVELIKIEDSVPEEAELQQPTDSLQLKLNNEQINAINKIVNSIEQKQFKTFLLHGITGSGKTEVYLQVIENCLKQGKQAIVLVPEISLTPQTLKRFENRFQKIAIMHSSLGEQQRLSEWSKIQKGEINIVVGARSAIFAPFQNIGVIIVDEEHDHSYKQDCTPRYHARDLAIIRAKNNQATVVLGSATPSLDSWYNTKLGKYELLSMRQRAGTGKLPTFHIVDLKKEVTENHNFEIFSDYLLQELKLNLKNKLQSIVFINRKGFYPHLSCRKCKEVIKCKSCDIRLTVYKKENNATCNYCGYRIKIPKSCPTCNHHDILFRGYGTERVTEVLQLLLPEARILRMDAKTMTTSAKHEKAYLDFKAHNYDILVGTQMIAKGLDFPKVTLVGILQIDASLSFLDFRMAEKTYQLISQVSGRAGRADHLGKVVIQTFSPEHYVIEFASETNYKDFAEKELESRHLLFYPPFSRLVKFLFKSKSDERLNNFINSITPIFKSIAAKHKVNCLGPAPAGIEKLENEFRQQFLIKTDTVKNRKAFIDDIVNNLEPSSGINYIIDIDPQSTL